MAGVDPISLAIGGAVIGGLTNKDDPVKGMVLGGAAGFAGGSLLSAGAAGAAPAAAAGAAPAAAAGSAVPAGTQMYASTVPGLASAAPGSQAAMLAAQTGEFGLGGLAATGAAAAPAGSLSAGMFDIANKALMPGASTPMQGLRAAQLFNQPSGGTRTAVSPPQMNRGREVNLASPIQSLLESQPMRRRKPLSLLG